MQVSGLAVAAIATLSLTLTACGGGDEDAATRTPTAPAGTTADASKASLRASTAPSTPAGLESATPGSPRDATDLAQHLQNFLPQVDKVTAVTEDNDPNNLLGRPNGYLAAAVISDSRLTQRQSGFGVGWGAMIEEYPDPGGAQRRADYIAGIASAAPMLANEWDHVHDRWLLRVSGDLKPSAHAGYANAWDEYWEGRTASTGGTSDTPPTAAASSATTSEKDALKAAVRSYSDAYLGGDAQTAWDLLSNRCRQRLTMAQMRTLTSGAQELYGRLDIVNLTIDDMSGNLARVTYTYPVAKLNQTQEPWVKENGKWREDDC